MRKINTQSFVRATRGTPREINRRIILNLIRELQPISRADIARKMGVGRGMVTTLVDELLAAGEVTSGDVLDVPRGRKPKMLKLRTNDRFVIAIDVRFSETFLMIADFSGHALVMDSFPTVTDPEFLVNELADRIRDLVGAHPRFGKCEGIGLVVPGMVDGKTGRVLNAPQLGWRDVDIRSRLEARTGLKVEIENAPIACALAQMWLTTSDEVSRQNFVYLTVSDGVGSAVVINGEVWRGQNSIAGEFGHVPLDSNGPHCLCGSRGCLEAYASNLATLSRYLGLEFSPVTAQELMRSRHISISEVIELARHGDVRARDSIVETGRNLGKGIATIVNVINPAQIFVGGEIAEAWEIVEPEIRAVLRQRALTNAAALTIVTPDPAHNLPRLRGATALVSAQSFAAPSVA